MFCVLRAVHSRMFALLFSSFCFQRLALGQHELSFKALDSMSLFLIYYLCFTYTQSPAQGKHQRARDCLPGIF